MKRTFKIAAIFLVITAVMTSLIACNDVVDNTPPVVSPQVSETPKNDEENNNQNNTDNKDDNTGDDKSDDANDVQVVIDLTTDYDKVKTLGRTSKSSNGIVCDHSASGIEFNGVMNGDVTVEMNTAGIKSDCKTTYFTVYIDGRRQKKRLSVEPGINELTIATFYEKGEHTVKLVKQTESNYTICELRTIKFTGEIYDAPANKDLYIEVIGDSLTCGMGNIGENSSPNPQTPEWEDASRSYGYMLADKLNADYSIVAQSGIGIAGSWFDPLFDFYTKSSYSRNKVSDYNEDYSFSARTPDIVIINLGTNDYYINRDKDPNLCKPEEVQQKTEEFIKLVRDGYGEDVPILWGYGFVGTFLFDNIKTAIDNLGGEAAGIYMCEFPEDKSGAQGHPDVGGHADAVNTLLPVVKKILGITE